MGKYKASDAKEQIEEIKVRWDRTGRDAAIWPESTVVTEENFEAVLEVLRAVPGRDVLAVRMGKAE